MRINNWPTDKMTKITYKQVNCNATLTLFLELLQLLKKYNIFMFVLQSA